MVNYLLICSSLVFIIGSISAIPMSMNNGVIDFFSFAGTPYIHIRKGRINFQNAKQVQDKAPAKANPQNAAQDVAHAYADIKQIEKEEQAKLNVIDEINKDIKRQQDIVDQLKHKQEAQAARNTRIAQNLNAKANNLAHLQNEKAAVLQDLRNLEKLLRQDLQAQEVPPVANREQIQAAIEKAIQKKVDAKQQEVKRPRAQRIVADRDQIKAVFDNAIQNKVEAEREVEAKLKPAVQKVVADRDQVQVAYQNKMIKQIADAVAADDAKNPAEQQQVKDMQARIQALEKAITFLAHQN